MRPLQEAMLWGSILPVPWNKHLDNFDNQAATFLHELFHVDLAANTFNDYPNPRIIDINLQYRTLVGLSSVVAFGSLFSRSLAKYDGSEDPYGNDAGFYTQRNGKSFP
jgi:hypothetical protein